MGQHMLQKAFLHAVIFLCLLFTSYAQTLESATLDDVLSETGDMEERIAIVITGNTDATFSFAVPEEAMKITANGKNAQQSGGVVSIPLSCQTCQINISYVIPSPLKKEGMGIFTFSRTINFPKFPASMEYRLHLPTGFVIDKVSQDPSIVPANAALTSDGTNILLVWEEKNPALPIRYFVRMNNHEGLEQPTEEVINEFSEWPVWVIGAVLLAMGVWIGSIMRAKKEKGGKQKPKNVGAIPSSLLTPDERTILKTLKENKGMTQKEVGVKLVWSKSKVSALMTALERKEIIKREKIGRNFKVEVVKEIES